jgi:hypothetical protein
MIERTGIEDRVFEPVKRDQISDLPSLYEELQWVGNSMESLTWSDYN